MDDFRIRVESALVVAAEERDGAADGLNVEATAAGRAVVDEQIREAFEKFVPQAVHASDVFDFHDACAVLLVVLAEEIRQIHIEILSVATEIQ